MFSLRSSVSAIQDGFNYHGLHDNNFQEKLLFESLVLLFRLSIMSYRIFKKICTCQILMKNLFTFVCILQYGKLVPPPTQ